MSKKGHPNHYGSTASNVNILGSSSSHGVKPTCGRCGKNYFEKCLASNGGCFSCGKIAIR